MKGFWLSIVAVIELVAISSSIGIYLQKKHYGAEGYPHIVLSSDQAPNIITFNPKRLLSYFSFIGIAELENKTALDHSASFCLLVTVCLSTEDKKYVKSVEKMQYDVLDQVISLSEK